MVVSNQRQLSYTRKRLVLSSLKIHSSFVRSKSINWRHSSITSSFSSRLHITVITLFSIKIIYSLRPLQNYGPPSDEAITMHHIRYTRAYLGWLTVCEVCVVARVSRLIGACVHIEHLQLTVARAHEKHFVTRRKRATSEVGRHFGFTQRSDGFKL